MIIVAVKCYYLFIFWFQMHYSGFSTKSYFRKNAQRGNKNNFTKKYALSETKNPHTSAEIIFTLNYAVFPLTYIFLCVFKSSYARHMQKYSEKYGLRKMQKK